jgi:hypothetical protein
VDSSINCSGLEPEAKEGMENNEEGGLAKDVNVPLESELAGAARMAGSDGGSSGEGAIARCASGLEEGAAVARCNFCVAARFEARGRPEPRDERRFFLLRNMRELEEIVRDQRNHERKWWNNKNDHRKKSKTNLACLDLEETTMTRKEKAPMTKRKR